MSQRHAATVHGMQLMYQCGVRTECVKRLDLIRPHVHGTMLDVGCAEGYFTHMLAAKCVEVNAIDNEMSNIETCMSIDQPSPNVIWRHLRVEEWLKHDITMETTLYMAVHHHLISQIGMEPARDVLKRLLQLTSGTLVFEMGQKNERGCQDYFWWQSLPDVSPDIFIMNELSLAGAKAVEKIGSTGVHGVQRGLWVASA